jgi:hypothetical protein
MQNLKKAIEDQIKQHSSGEEDDHYTIDTLILDDAAKQWAKHSLKTYKGKTLRKALRISESIANFSAHLLKKPS